MIAPAASEQSVKVANLGVFCRFFAKSFVSVFVSVSVFVYASAFVSVFDTKY